MHWETMVNKREAQKLTEKTFLRVASRLFFLVAFEKCLKYWMLHISDIFSSGSLYCSP